MHNSVLYNYSPQELQNILDSSYGYSDVLKKSGLSSHGNNHKTLKRIIAEYNLSTVEFDKNREEHRRKKLNEVQGKKRIPLSEIIYDNIHPDYQSSRLLKRLTEETIIPYRCEICGINKWNGEKLSLELHHIDCNHRNNHISNLQILCPNCHSVVHSEISRKEKAIQREKALLRIKNNIYTMKQKGLQSIPIDRESLKKDIRELPMIKVGVKYNVSDNTIRKWCKKYGLPFSSREIRRMTEKEWDEI